MVRYAIANAPYACYACWNNDAFDRDGRGMVTVFQIVIELNDFLKRAAIDGNSATENGLCFSQLCLFSNHLRKFSLITIFQFS